MAQMNISNLLWNDTREGKIALAKQIFDNVNWEDYHYTGDDGQVVYPFNNKGELDKFQSKLNEIFLNHYTDFQTFLHTKGIDGVIDTWKDVEEFLRGITDDETATLMSIIEDLQIKSGQLNIRMSDNIPGMLEAITMSDIPQIRESYIDPETGAIKLVYNYDNSYKEDLGDNLKFTSNAATATAKGTMSNAPQLINTYNVPVTYKSSNTDVATVSNNGTITVLKDGEAVISAVFAGNPDYLSKTVQYTLTVALAFNVNDYIESTSEIENPEFSKVIIDKEDEVLWGQYKDGTTADYDLSNEYFDRVSVKRVVDAAKALMN